MYRINQIRIEVQDRYCLLVPRLEKEQEREVRELIKKNDLIIKIGCLISYFSLKLVILLSGFCFQMSDDQRIIFIISSTILQALSCLLCGFFVDVVNIKSTWCFTILLNIVFSFIHLISGLTNDISVFFFAKIASYFLIPICIVNFTCVLYDASIDFRDRLNNAVVLEAFGDYFPVIFTMSLNIVLKQFFHLSKEEIVVVQKNIMTYGIVISLFLNLISLVILNLTYYQIQKIKIQSIKYQRFLIYQGFGLSISKISQYMCNKNIYYILVLAALCGCQNSSFYNQGKNVNTQKLTSLLSVIINAFGMVASIIIMRFVNSRKRLVQSNYKTASCCAYLFLVSCVSQFIIFQYNTHVSDTVFLIITTIISSVKEALFLVLYCVIHQIVILLLPNRITMRAISLSITFFPYFLFKGFNVLISHDLYWQRLIQIFITIIAVIINFFYQRNISFDIIEQKLIKQYHLQ